MGFDSQRAVVATGDGVVARFPGILCVAEGGDPHAVRALLALCAGVAGPDPGRALARRLATWMSGAEAPPDTLRFGTLAAAGAQVAVFLVGDVDAWIDGPDGAVLSGADAAIGTDRLLPVPDAPLVLSAGDVRLPADVADVHDLRAGVVAGAGVVLHPARPGGDRPRPPAAAERTAPPSPFPTSADGSGHDWFAESRPEPAPEGSAEELPASPAPRNGSAGHVNAGHVNGRGSVAWPWPADAGAPRPGRGGAGMTGRHAILDAPARREDQLLTGSVDLVDGDPADLDLVDAGLADRREPHGEATGRTAGYGDDGGGMDPHGTDRDRAERDGAGEDPTCDARAEAAADGGDPHDLFRGHRNGRTVVDVTPYGVLSTAAIAPVDTAGPPPDPADSMPTGLVPTSPAPADAVPTDAVPEVVTVAQPADSGPAEPDTVRGEGAYTDDDPASGASLTSGYLCANGHLADPRAPFCAVCGTPVDDRAGGLVEGSRPALGRLVFDDGATYTVDAGYLVGRMPEADDRVVSGDLRPIIVEDRTGSVSRVHVAIEISGWDVMLLDVGSRNGTFVAGPEESGWSPLPAQRGRRLLPGTRVRLGGRTFVFESSSGVR